MREIVDLDVPQVAFTTALDNLRNRINFAPDFDRGGEDIAYALYVLAREGAAAIGDLRYYADEKATALGHPARQGATGGGVGRLRRSQHGPTRCSQQRPAI